MKADIYFVISKEGNTNDYRVFYKGSRKECRTKVADNSVFSQNVEALHEQSIILPDYKMQNFVFPIRE
jgi:hypothetical protein